MHPPVYYFVARCAERVYPDFGSVLEIGSRDANGSVRDLFPMASPYVGLDITPGPCVDVVADAADWEPDREYGVVVSTEVLEHTPAWSDVCQTAYRALAPGGYFILTCATTGRGKHNAHGKPELDEGEWYGNVGMGEFGTWADGRFQWLEVTKTAGADLQVFGRKW